MSGGELPGTFRGCHGWFTPASSNRGKLCGVYLPSRGQAFTGPKVALVSGCSPKCREHGAVRLERKAHMRAIEP